MQKQIDRCNKIKPYKLKEIQTHTTNSFIIYPYHNNRSIEIDNIQALQLELLLNKSIHSKEWILLGDQLYMWRNDPKYIQIDVYDYEISTEQYDWILKTLSDNNNFSL